MLCRVSKLEQHQELQRPDVLREDAGKRVLECRSPFTLARIRYFLGRKVVVSHAVATPMRKIHVLFPPAQEWKTYTRLWPKKTTDESSGWLSLCMCLLVSNLESVRLQRDHRCCVFTDQTSLGPTRTRDHRRLSGKQSTVATSTRAAACNPLRSSHGLRTTAAAPELQGSPSNRKITVIKIS